MNFLIIELNNSVVLDYFLLQLIHYNFSDVVPCTELILFQLVKPVYNKSRRIKIYDLGSSGRRGPKREKKR